MSKIQLLMVAVCVLLCVKKVDAQERDGKVYTLDEIFQLAETNSKQLKLSHTRIETSKAAVSTAKNSLLPSIDASLSGSFIGNACIIDRDLGHGMHAPMPHWGNSFSVEASQVVFAGGAIKNNIDKAKLEEQVARLDYQKDAMDIRFLLTGYYLDLYKIQNQKKVYQENIKQTKLLIEQVRAKQKQGMALDNDITRHELLLKNLELAIIEIDNNYDIINNNLVLTLGLPSNSIIKPDSTILQLNMADYKSDNFMTVAENNLPELKTAALQTQIAEKGIKMAKADYLPSVAIVAANVFDGPILVEVPPINKNLNYWYVGIGVKYNLSSLFKSKKNVRLAKNNRQMSIEAHDLIHEHIETAIYSAYTKYKESFEIYQTREKSLQLANENYNVINKRYKNDLVLITEMLDASNSKLDAELQLVNARINIIYNYYKLQRTIGKL